jgi:hypothetical protein
MTDRKPSHVIERTSPKGPEHDFIGRCIRCGREGLRVTDAVGVCENTSGMTDEQAMIKAVEGP